MRARHKGLFSEARRKFLVMADGSGALIGTRNVTAMMATTVLRARPAATAVKLRVSLVRLLSRSA